MLRFVRYWHKAAITNAGWDQDGWPHFEQLRELPVMNLMEQDNFLKDHVLFYFEQNDF